MDIKSFSPPFETNCEKCNQAISITTHFQCAVFVCSGCRESYRFRNNSLINNNSRIDTKDHQEYIPLGAVGKIRKRLYKMIGFAVKKEKGTPYRWREYLLFNPYYGYAFLAEYDGHWTFLEQLIVHPKEVVIKNDFAFDRKWFRFFSDYKSVLVYAQGEFCYDVFKGSESEIRELISPPYILSYERSNEEQMWLYGEHIDEDDIKDAFAIKEDPPEQVGIGICQPMKGSLNYTTLMRLTGIFIGVLVVLQFVMTNLARNEKVLSESFSIRTDSLGNMLPLVSESFEITKAPANLELEFYSSVDNSWMEFSTDAINETTSEHYGFTTAVEYYHGYDGGESWSEGGPAASSVLSHLPKGKYHLNIWPTRGDMRADTFSVSAKTDFPMYSNMFAVAGVILLFPLITYLRRRGFEERRWSNSYYSPYEEE